LLLPLSLAVYAVTLTFGFNIPTWPLEGRWFFDPLAWQLVFVLGFVLAGKTSVGGWARNHLSTWRWIAVPVVLAGIAVGVAHYAPDPLSLPEPRLFLMFDKTFESPARIVHLLALVVVCRGLFPLLHRTIPRLTGFLSMLGRNSLPVFCIGSILSLCGQLARFAFDGTILCDILVVVIGITTMSATAWLVEWRDRYEAA
ncbi:MAG TPA: OpgC domain-containing protein, partial [Beijerinckiaceae bacterium]|nr:OpgC domain-containing protein [Beijerinckiaceae bacterium]